MFFVPNIKRSPTTTFFRKRTKKNRFFVIVSCVELDRVLPGSSLSLGPALVVASHPVGVTDVSSPLFSLNLNIKSRKTLSGSVLQQLFEISAFCLLVRKSFFLSFL